MPDLTHFQLTFLRSPSCDGPDRLALALSPAGPVDGSHILIQRKRERSTTTRTAFSDYAALVNTHWLTSLRLAHLPGRH